VPTTDPVEAALADALGKASSAELRKSPDRERPDRRIVNTQIGAS
jgi:hypothetical protein